MPIKMMDYFCFVLIVLLFAFDHAISSFVYCMVVVVFFALAAMPPNDTFALRCS